MGLRTSGVSSSNGSRIYRINSNYNLIDNTRFETEFAPAEGLFENPPGSNPAATLNLPDLDIVGKAPNDVYRMGPLDSTVNFPSNATRAPGILGNPQIAEASRAPGIGAIEQVENNPTANMELEKRNLDKRMEELEKTQSARTALTFLKDGTNIVNSYYKYQSIKADNQANIMQANKALMELESDAAFAKLRQQTQGESRGKTARMSAVARGQSSTGDVALSAVSNEEIYAIQQMALIDVNAMRQAIGLENQITQLETSTIMARAQRNTDIANSIASMGVTASFM